MCVVEKAARLGSSTLTLCLKSSPIEFQLKKQGLPFVSVHSRKYFSLSTVRTLRKIFREISIKNVIVQTLADLWHVVPALRGHSRIKLIGISHTFLKVRKKDFLHRLLYQRVDTLVCLTQSHRENLIANLAISPEKIKLIPNGVEAGRFANVPRPLSTGFYTVGVVGRLDPAKGQDDFLRAAELLIARGFTQIQFWVVGEDTLDNPGSLARLKKFCDQRGIEDHVRFFGFVENIEIVLNQLDLIVVPSERETFGRIVLEAMAAQTPVIATRAGGIVDILEDDKTGTLIQPSDVEALARAIEKHYLKREWSKQLAQRAHQESLPNYDLERVESQFLDLLL